MPAPRAHADAKPSNKSRRLGGVSKSLTPGRKHHKVIKGTGEEVWPSDIEQIFKQGMSASSSNSIFSSSSQGLEEYMSHPNAYVSTGGRNKLRNQFLVNHLLKHGVSRTKKQVASHLQVLRNMWKGCECNSSPFFDRNGVLTTQNRLLSCRWG